MIELPKWVKRYLQKQPSNLTGQLVFTFQEGFVQQVERYDRVTESLFYQRYGEFKPQGHSNGHTTPVNGSTPERLPGE